MGAGKSRKVVLYKATGGTIIFSDGSKEYAGSSWEELVSSAGPENNFYNCFFLEALQKEGLYETNKNLRDRFFDEDSLYLVNQIVKSYKIQEQATGGNPMFMYTRIKWKEEGTKWVGKVDKDDSRILIDVDNRMSKEELARNNGSVLAKNSEGRITINTFTMSSKGVIDDLRKPSVSESIHKGDYKSGWGSTDSVVGSILHEYGHSVETAIMHNYSSSYKQYLNETSGGVSEMVSKYPASYKDKYRASRENFAEAYAAYVTGTPLPNNTSKNYYSSFKKLMKSVGIKEGSNSATKPQSTPHIGASPNRSSSVSRTDSTPLRGSVSLGVTPTSRRGSTTSRPTPSTRGSITSGGVRPVSGKPTTSIGATSKSITPRSTTPRKATQFLNSQGEISGVIRGTKFSAKITPGILSKGFITRTIGRTKYKIDINTGSFEKI